MRFVGILWRQRFADKIVREHHVELTEVEEVLLAKPFVRRRQRGRKQGEDLYVAYGQTQAGRYVVVFLIRKEDQIAMPISARDMTQAERRYYESQK